MGNEPIKQTYRDVEVIYVESSDHWNFIVNGRERNAESLAKAKEFIDRSLDYERKEKPWKPFAAYHKDYNRDFTPITVTSEADRGYGSARYFWVSRSNPNGSKQRSKESELEIYAATPENEAAIARWRELNAEVDRIEAEKRVLVEGMAKIAPTADATTR